jgi:pyruvate/2-oxoglutarate dehydrogenase complex dihydrolipoamide dehydrogenase (E3) component
MRLVVLGGGPAGINAALHAQELGAEVTLIEAGQVGGTSLNHGPAPVRTLARAARLMRDAKSWERLGVRGETPQIDIVAALASARRVADYIHDENRLGEAVRRSGIDLLHGVGPAVFVDPHTVRISAGREFRGDAVLIAVGGHAGRLPIPGVELALTYENLRDLESLPTAAAVVGGADTGCQLASILSDFGVEITLIEAGPRLLPHADQDVSDAFVAALRGRGIDVALSARLDRLERSARGITAHYESATQQRELEVGAVFLAVGWPGNADSTEAAKVGIETDRGYVKVDDSLRSNLPHVFAAGDVNGISMLVPSARLEGRVAAENAVLGTRRTCTHEVVPCASFTYPEYGSVGLTEAQARELYDVEVGIARYEDLVRPNIDDFPEGFCKLIVDRQRCCVLGAHVVGAYSAEVIQTASVCVAANLRIEQIAELRPAFPTFTEGITVAAQAIVRQLGLAPTAPTWGELRGTEPAP